MKSNADIALPHLLNARTEMHEPRLMESSTLSELPVRMHPKMLKLCPSCRLPPNESSEPNRTLPRTLNELPKLAKSTTDKADPHLATDRHDNEDPRVSISMMLRLDPNRARLKTEKTLPQRIAYRKLIEEPKFV
jgi:hypothetical protein